MNTNRRNFLKMLGAGVVLTSTGSFFQCTKNLTGKPNIVLCMADDQGWGDMGYYDHPHLQTPHFDQMAAESLRFDRFYAAAPVCSPTRGSVLTGRHPNRFGCFKWGYAVRPQEITLAEALKTAGYTTGHFGKWHIGTTYKNSPTSPGANGFDEWFSAPNFFDNDPILSREGTAVQTHGESSAVTANAAIEFIQKHAEAKNPFLAVVWFGSPHRPHRAIEKDRALYADQPENMRGFYGEITGMDRAFGKLRQTLRDLNIQDNTLLWYCSDNGGLPGKGVNGGREHKSSIYEGGLRVPAMLEWPAQLKVPAKTATPCCTTDIYPTLLEIADVKMPHQPVLDGISLVPLMQQKMTKRPQPLGFWDYPEKGHPVRAHEILAELLAAQQTGQSIPKPEPPYQIERQYPTDSFPGHSAWLDWPWKLHRIENPADSTITLELYNLANDPDEARNLTDEKPTLVQKMETALEAWLVSVVDSLNGADYEPA